jgi:hypothetical protein
MASMWRKRKGVQYDTWHKCSNCPNWPTTDYIESANPTSGEKCDGCRAKIRDGRCS